MAVNYTEEQLNNVDKSFLIQLLLQQQEQLNALTKELHASNEKMQLLMEQVILGKQNRFGRSSEKMEDTSQICFREVNGTIVFFNEAEAVCDLNAAEPEDLELKSPKQPKRKGKKEADLSGLPVRRIDHYLSAEELEAEFGVRGWKQLPDAISRKYHFVPAKVEVEEHHIGVYASKTDEHMVKADHPKTLLHGSLVSPSLGAAIINGKYVNAVPLYRLEQEFQRYGLQITRQNMANWCIRLAEEYLSILYDYLHKELYFYHVIQADETPVLVNHDGRKAVAIQKIGLLPLGDLPQALVQLPQGFSFLINLFRRFGGDVRNRFHAQQSLFAGEHFIQPDFLKPQPIFGIDHSLLISGEGAPNQIGHGIPDERRGIGQELDADAFIIAGNCLQ